MGIFKQAMEASKAKKITKQKSILARMFPGALASMLGSQVSHNSCTYVHGAPAYLLLLATQYITC